MKARINREIIMKILTLLVLVTLLFFAGCKTMTQPEPVKALLSDMNQPTKLQIVKAVSKSMDGKSVRIADSVFSTENRMSVMTNMEATFNGNPINGAVTEKPQHFLLMLRGNACYLVHEETGIEYSLENVKCKAM